MAIPPVGEKRANAPVPEVFLFSGSWGWFSGLLANDLKMADGVATSNGVARSSAQQGAAASCTLIHNFMTPIRITANLPATLERPVRLTARREHYPSESDLGLGLVLWDIYSRQPHEMTGPLLRLPRWEVESAALTLAEELQLSDEDARGRKPYRFTTSVPGILRKPMMTRMKEERYRSASAYVTGLVFFCLKVREPNPKKIPHHKCAALLREPDYIRDVAFAKLAKDFGNPKRKWPKP